MDWVIFGFSLVAAVIGWLVVQMIGVKSSLRTLWEYIFGASAVPESQRHGMAQQLDRIEERLDRIEGELRRMNGNGSSRPGKED